LKLIKLDGRTQARLGGEKSPPFFLGAARVRSKIQVRFSCVVQLFRKSGENFAAFSLAS